MRVFNAGVGNQALNGRQRTAAQAEIREEICVAYGQLNINLEATVV